MTARTQVQRLKSKLVIFFSFDSFEFGFGRISFFYDEFQDFLPRASIGPRDRHDFIIIPSAIRPEYDPSGLVR